MQRRRITEPVLRPSAASAYGRRQSRQYRFEGGAVLNGPKEKAEVYRSDTHLRLNAAQLHVVRVSKALGSKTAA